MFSGVSDLSDSPRPVTTGFDCPRLIDIPGWLIITVLFAFVLISCGPSLEEQARTGLRSKLKDSSSAQFIELRKSEVGRICGQVNSKNSYGAYAGYSHFYVWDSLVVVDDEDSEFHLARDICNAK